MKYLKKSYRLLYLSVKVSLYAAIFLASNIVHAQNVHIDGKIENDLADSVLIRVYPYFSYYWQNNNSTKFEAECVNNKFDFESKLESCHSYISIYLKNKNSYTSLILLYLIVPGDSVHMLIRRDSILFSGKGSEKYTCQYRMQKVPDISFSTEDFLAFDNNTNSYAFNMYMMKKIDSLLKVKFSILKEYESRMPLQSYKQLKVNYVSENLFKQYNSLDFHYDPTEDVLVRNDKIKFFNELQKQSLPGDADGTLIAESSYASEFLLCKAIRKLQFDSYVNRKQFEEKYSPFNLAMLACGKLNGLVKERLLAISYDLFYRPEEQKDTAELTLALNETKRGYFHRYLYSLKAAMNPGRKAYDFKLVDRDDNTVRLSDFRDKVIVLDFWFTGCGYCIKLEKRMKDIRNFFKDDSNVAFLSVCLDADKETFLKGVASGNYTGESEINLYTGGEAFDHPLAKYYNITGCPELVIIDKDHKTFISKPDRPIDEKSDRDFINLIEEAKH